MMRSALILKQLCVKGHKVIEVHNSVHLREKSFNALLLLEWRMRLQWL
jgi:hypothetical protein